jgi:glycosyltransferase involved in cell wall biosynthesis
MKKIFYWSPCLQKVGTYKSTLNSAISLAKYANNLYSVNIINVCGEWDEEEEQLKQFGVDLINLNFKYFKYLPKNGFIKSRFSYFIIFIFSIVPLIFCLNKHRPNIVIIHLLTSLPLSLKYFFRLNTEIILRVSGFPKLNFLRKNFWKLVSKKINYILCPTLELRNQLESFKEFKEVKIRHLCDPVLTANELLIKRKPELNKLYLERINFLTAGRFTRQKNYLYLISEFNEYLKTNPNATLTVFGDGEDKKKIISKINKLNLNNNVFIKDYVNNLYYYMKKADAYILSSLWEDPGHVLIEAAANNLFIISSNCHNGPKEFLDNGNGGILFSSNKKNAIKDSLIYFDNLKVYEKKQKKLLAKKKSLNYTLLRHYNKLINFL